MFESLTPTGIWSIRQNKPSLVARDLEELGVPREMTHTILLARGVYKWLAVRRDLIKLKDTWKGRVSNALDAIRQAKAEHNHGDLQYWRGYLKAYEEARGEVRALCHSERWRAPDFDEEAQRFLVSLSANISQ